MSELIRIASVLGSRWLLFSLAGAWIFYYVTVAVWSKEAFARFVGALDDNVAAQAFFVLLLISLLMNLVREGGARLRESRVLFGLWIVLPVGLFVFLAGFFTSSLLRQHTWLFRGEGGVVQPAWQEEAYVVDSIVPGLKDEMLDIGGSGIFQYEPKVLLATGGGPREVGVFPPAKIADTYYHILQFGLAPGVRLSQGGEVLEEGYLMQKILPPGVVDVFTIEPYPYRFSIRMAPDRTITKGRSRAEVYSFEDPSYIVTVFRGEQTVFEGDSRDGIEFEGLDLQFLKPTYWVMLEAAKDPGYLVIVGGLALISLGVPLALVLIAVRLLRGRRLEE